MLLPPVRIASITASYIETPGRSNPLFHILKDFFSLIIQREASSEDLPLPPFAYVSNSPDISEVAFLLLPERHNNPEDRARNSQVAAYYARNKKTTVYAERSKSQAFAMLNTLLMPTTTSYSQWEDLSAIDALYGNVSERFFAILEYATTQLFYLQEFEEKPRLCLPTIHSYFLWLTSAKVNLQSHPEPYKGRLLHDIALLEALPFTAQCRQLFIQQLTALIFQGVLLHYIASLQHCLSGAHFKARQASLLATLEHHATRYPDRLAIVVAGSRHIEEILPEMGCYHFLAIKSSGGAAPVEPSGTEIVGIGELLALLQRWLTNLAPTT